jgi:uncharacterized protein YndB with AHSA1/START domain
MIEKSVLLACVPDRAFALFTERASDWWPTPLRHTGDERSEIRMLAGGRFWERAADGREVELGRVTAWEPPKRLILDFYPGTDEQHPTEVVVSFADEGHGTRVSVAHRPKTQSAELWADGAPRFARSWDLVLGALAEAAA